MPLPQPQLDALKAAAVLANTKATEATAAATTARAAATLAGLHATTVNNLVNQLIADA